MSFTYSTLKSAIQNYADNTETTFVANLDNFIKAAEQRILNSIDLQYFRKNVSGTVTADNQYLAVPTDYLASFSLSVVNSSNKEFLLETDVKDRKSTRLNSSHSQQTRMPPSS